MSPQPHMHSLQASGAVPTYFGALETGSIVHRLFRAVPVPAYWAPGHVRRDDGTNGVATDRRENDECVDVGPDRLEPC